MDSLDRHGWEADLIEALEDQRQEIEKQMSITETLSKDKGGAQKSYLLCQNGWSLTRRYSYLIPLGEHGDPNRVLVGRGSEGKGLPNI